MVVNTPTGSGARTDGWEIRGAAIARGVPCLTTLSGGLAAARAIAGAHRTQSTVTALQDVHGTRRLPARTTTLGELAANRPVVNGR
jgi:carbamoyl-phosphate synthase large subunit